MKNYYFVCLISFCLASSFLQAQKGDPKLTEVWKPVPAVIIPGANLGEPPSDAVILFQKVYDTANWINGTNDFFGWTVSENFFTVKPKTGVLSTRKSFGDCQLHVEWRTPAMVKGEGQGRGNSGIFLMGRYELQVLDSYNNATYSNGQAGSIYKQKMPLVNAAKPPGEWQSYDIIFTAPVFNSDSTVKLPARITVFHNGILIQNNFEIWGSTEYIGIPSYTKHESKAPLVLQDHGDLVSFRNIWIREL